MPDHTHQRECVERPGLRVQSSNAKSGALLLGLHRLALLVGLLLAAMVLLAQLYWQWRGASIPPMSLLLRLLFVFTTGYAISGVFMWFLAYKAALKERDDA